MRIVWDEAKRAANLVKHGYDFAEFARAFDRDTALTLPTAASRLGRVRYLLLGTWNETRVVAVITSPLGREALSLVSVRTASPQEREAYERHAQG
ncbi:BrnT family toxin [Methylobacterium oryzisoli]|uniref:BrnT family toxin n=1 Tax=Methylobacterium oryzisoli TaxID=3385502 RepID=UPI0038916A8C